MAVSERTWNSREFPKLRRLPSIVLFLATEPCSRPLAAPLSFPRMLMINVIIVTTQAMPTLHSSFGRQRTFISLLAEARVPMFLFICMPLMRANTARIHRTPIKADSTLRTSRAVPHPSTNRARCRLTSEVERDPVHSTRYGRQRENMEQPVIPEASQASKHCFVSRR
jgi:hypothetical protein